MRANIGQSYALRCALIEVMGNLIIMHSKKLGDERDETHKKTIEALFAELDCRFLDINPHCRCRAMQVLMKIWDLDKKFRNTRLTFAELAARSLQDKSSFVRRNAIKLLSKMVTTHPYNKACGARLSRTEWENLGNKLMEAIEIIDDEMSREQDPDETMEMTMAPGHEEVAQKHPDEMTDEEKIAVMRKMQWRVENQERMQKKELLEKELEYVNKALEFIGHVETGADHITQLLSSKNKNEVIDAMDFFKVIDAYSVDNAGKGVRRMLRLIWSKGNSDEGKGIQAHLIDCYQTLHFAAPPHFSPGDAAKYIANNMISLTFGTTPAELISLEQLLSTMMQQGLIKPLVIQKLWEIYGSQRKDISRSRRRGAIIVLGMLALANPSIIQAEMQTCLDIGLGPRGRRDLGLARYTCVALKRISPASSKQSPGAPPPTPVKLPNSHEVLKKLAAITMLITEDQEYFGLAEQAIGAIYVLSTHPDVLCSEIIREKTKKVFGEQAQQQRESAKPAAMDHDGDTEMGDIEMDDAPPAEAPAEADPPVKKQNSAFALSQLLFIVGHVAIKQIVHLELCEQEFKRRKAEKDSEKKKKEPRQSTSSEAAAPAKRGRKKAANKDPTPAAEEADELDMMAGTSEDVITDQMNAIREQHLLDPEGALLGQFGPLVKEICSNNLAYNHPTLQAQAALCLAKLMCISYAYCEENLTLLLTILQRSKDPVVRSNLVIAFGDIAVSFNQLIDQNTEFLYGRLGDSDPSVKRTCLMTLTFLILASQIKVKGQLGVMAKLIEDKDKKIKDMTRMFFTELATKDNQVYNHFTDMFSILSEDGELSEEDFKKIVKFLAGFVEKVCLIFMVVWGWSGVDCYDYRNDRQRHWQRNSRNAWQKRRTKSSGTKSPTRSACCSTRTRISRSSLSRASSWLRARLRWPVLVPGFV